MPAVALASLLLACFLPAQGEESRNIALERLPGGHSNGAEAGYYPEDPIQLPASRRDTAEPAALSVRSLASGVFDKSNPFWDSFYVKGGAYQGGKEMGLAADLRRNVEIGDMVFTSAEYGQLEGRAELQEKVPFVGGGFDASFQVKGRWDVSVLAGAAFYGAGQISPVPTTGQPLATRDVQQDIKQERYEVLPIVQVGLSYRF